MQGFIARAGWSDARISPLAGDASNRRYDRLTLPDGTHAVLMDAPSVRGENIRPFVQIASFLTGIGLSAPRILAQDEASGFLLLEDLGDDLFARLLETKPEREEVLYAAAVDALSHLHRADPPDLPRYDAQTTTQLAALAFDWYQFGATGQAQKAARADFVDAFVNLSLPLDTHPPVLIQRDYHAENLLWLPHRAGPARVGLLDFQDAMLGHSAYDLVSILQDARRDVSKQLEQAMISRFLDQNPQDRDIFRASYALLGLQRNLRILGVFARLSMRNGKAQYVDLIPRVWAHVKTNLKHPALSAIVPILEDALPSPTPDILNLLRSKCATYPNR